jgi:hypothetical protein
MTTTNQNQTGADIVSREADLSDAIRITLIAAAMDCHHAGCDYIATNWDSAKNYGFCELHKFDDITVIRDEDLPFQFRYENAYVGDDNEFTARANAFKAYCAANSIFYYARPRERFFKYEAFELCAAANCTKLLMEDMS